MEVAMKKVLEELGWLCLITILGTLGSMIAGLMVYGGDVFNPRSVGFVYILYGISTSFIFAFYHVRGLSNTITAAVSTGAIIFVIATIWMPLINAIIWSFGVNLCVVLIAFLFERKLANFKQWKFTVVALIYGAMFVLMTLLIDVLTNVTEMPAAVFQRNFLDGLWMGLGLGLGVEIAESLVHSVHLHREAKRTAKLA
jgi:hypothetical protein